MSAGDVAVLYWFITSAVSAFALWRIAKMPNPINRFAIVLIVSTAAGFATWPIWLLMVVRNGRSHHPRHGS